jgi:hypothetical protein
MLVLYHGSDRLQAGLFARAAWDYTEGQVRFFSPGENAMRYEAKGGGKGPKGGGKPKPTSGQGGK